MHKRGQGAKAVRLFLSFPGKAACLLRLRLKTSYLQKLPWMFAALAHPDAAVAREWAGKIKTAWLADPREDAHHRLTWKLMRPGSAFHEALDMLICGAAVDDLPIDFRWQIAAWRFTPCVETTIEEKHSRVAVCKRRHHVGPVRVSLANRPPLRTRPLGSLRAGLYSEAARLLCSVMLAEVGAFLAEH